MTYDFAIIGSGVSGGRIAYELVAGGAKCILLEAGRAFDRHTYPAGEMGYTTQMFWNGGLEVSRDGRIGLLRGKCLGGTSVVNQADLNRFDQQALDLWCDRSGIDFFTLEAMQPLYEHVEAGIPHGPIPPEHYNRNARLFTEGFDKLGYGWRPITRAQDDCRLDQGSDCIVCLGGCPRDAKQSTLITSIPAARQLGLEIETEFEVDSLEERNGSVHVRGMQRGEQREIEAAKVVLAAGAMGNTKLLFRSPRIARDLPALGSRFCCHPQFMTYALFAEPVDAHKGPLQSVESHDPRLRQAGIKLENVYAPPIATAMLIPGVREAHQAQMRKYRYFASLEVAICDEPAGRIRVDRKGRIRVDKPLTDADRAKLQRGYEIVEEFLAAVDPVDVVRCRQAYGLHLMGGCPIGVDPRASVVAPDFTVHGHPRLYAADSSIFPTAPGINPSLSIMALSHKASQMMLSP